MSLFKSQMFLEDAPILNLDFGEEHDTFGPTYGHHAANEKVFRRPWDQRRRDPSSQSIPADAHGAAGCC